jgi:Tfp pilus assembly protein FimT
MFDIVYAEDNPLWILAGLLVAVALLAIVAVLGAFYLVGVWLSRRLDRWVEDRSTAAPR